MITLESIKNDLQTLINMEQEYITKSLFDNIEKQVLKTIPNKHFNIITNMLKYFEGYKQFEYKDSLGHLTIGYGHYLTKTTLNHSLTKEQAKNILHKDIIKHEKYLFNYISEENLMLHPVQVRMFFILQAFNMGYNLQKFKIAKRQLSQMEYGTLKNNFKNSLWAEQVKKRRTQPTLKLLTLEYEEVFEEFSKEIK